MKLCRISNRPELGYNEHMNVLSIFAHPRTDSFCQAVFDTANEALTDLDTIL